MRRECGTGESREGREGQLAGPLQGREGGKIDSIPGNPLEQGNSVELAAQRSHHIYQKILIRCNF